jgi:hypothetical protein
MASAPRPSSVNTLQLQKFTPAESSTKRREISDKFSRLSLMDRKHAKFTDQQVDVLKSYRKIHGALLNTTSAQDIVGVLKEFAPLIADIHCKAFVLRQALNARRGVSRKSIEMFNSGANIALEKNMVDARLATYVKCSKDYTLDVLQTNALMFFTEFVKNMRTCMIYKNLSSKLGVTIDLLPSDDVKALEAVAASSDLAD